MDLIYADSCAEEEPWVRAALPQLDVHFTAASLSSDEPPAGAQDASALSVFVGSRVDRALLERLPNLKFIAVRSTGVDHIDLAACRERGVMVANVPSYGERTVAEHAFALILALSRKVCRASARTARLNFERSGLRGFDLYGKTLGVVGTGRIGRNALRYGRCFGMNLIAFDARPVGDGSDEGFRYVDTLDQLLAQSDVISLHVPYLPTTHHLINNDNVKRIKRGALLINTARGGVVDTAALLWALEQGILAGAGLDVLEHEMATFCANEIMSQGLPEGVDASALLRNHMLAGREDVILTPHNAYNSAEAFRSIVDITNENIAAFLAGKPINLVPPAA